VAEDTLRAIERDADPVADVQDRALICRWIESACGGRWHAQPLVVHRCDKRLQVGGPVPRDVVCEQIFAGLPARDRGAEGAVEIVHRALLCVPARAVAPCARNHLAAALNSVPASTSMR